MLSAKLESREEVKAWENQGRHAFNFRGSNSKLQIKILGLGEN